ncbi:ORF6N domain-containing protein [Acinetobacter sp. YH12039]|uniref:ORF6N domain-containing protein n=1 Tax=Acinetobacter sp. YH12039 TaxID=2601047 RepID=UPI0015D391B8|nr:ORF6N domain-containing protein [Acinetobacter sp. YH12039]
MNALVKPVVQVAEKQTAIIEFKSEPVLLTEQLAEFYGTDSVRIRQNHDRNNERFVEGKHFFKITGQELKDFASSLKILTNYPEISSKTRSLMLWTEKGAARHAKILDTDQAWSVFEQLEDCYFTVKSFQESPINASGKKSNVREISSTLKCCLSMAKMIGLEGNQAILSADRAVQKITGESPLQLLDATHLHSPVQEQVFTPTQIGEMLEPKLSGQKVNKVLVDLGYQVKEDDIWLMTEKAQGLGELFDTGKKHSDGVPVKQLKWYQSVVQLVKGFVE